MAAELYAKLQGKHAGALAKLGGASSPVGRMLEKLQTRSRELEAGLQRIEQGGAEAAEATAARARAAAPIFQV